MSIVGYEIQIKSDPLAPSAVEKLSSNYLTVAPKINLFGFKWSPIEHGVELHLDDPLIAASDIVLGAKELGKSNNKTVNAALLYAQAVAYQENYFFGKETKEADPLSLALQTAVALSSTILPKKHTSEIDRDVKAAFKHQI